MTTDPSPNILIGIILAVIFAVVTAAMVWHTFFRDDGWEYDPDDPDDRNHPGWGS